MKLQYRALAASLLLSTTVPIFADDASEPPVAYTLEINGQQHDLSPDKPVTISGDFNNPEVTLRVSETRTLEAAGVVFRYPAYFTYEADTADPDVQTWIVDGRDVTVMLFQFSGQITPQALAQSTAEELASDNSRLEDVTLKLGSHDCSGVQAEMAFASQSIIQQTVALPANGRQSRLLVIQEVRGEEDSESSEMSSTIKLIASSLKLKP